MRYLHIITLLAIVGLGYVQWTEHREIKLMQQQLLQLQENNGRQAALLESTQQQLLTLQSRSKQLESETLKGLAEKANGAFFKGLESLLDSVGEEVKRAKKNIENHQQPQATPDSAKTIEKKI